jgi:hypothetical protein
MASGSRRLAHAALRVWEFKLARPTYMSFEVETAEFISTQKIAARGTNPHLMSSS